MARYRIVDDNGIYFTTHTIVEWLPVNAGFSPWQDVKDILPGEDWHKMLMRAIKEAPFFLFCLSNNSVDKRGVIQEEIKEALQMWRQKLEDDIYFIPVRLEEVEVQRIPEALKKFQWVDLFADGGFEKLVKALRVGIKQLGLVSRQLRSNPITNLSEQDVRKMLQELDFYCQNKNWMGKGIQHHYEAQEINGDKVVIDHTTGLMWQRGGSSEHMNYEDAQKYVAELNQKKYASYNDWRLPTLEEVMSLMEVKAIQKNLQEFSKQAEFLRESAKDF